MDAVTNQQTNSNFLLAKFNYFPTIYDALSDPSSGSCLQQVIPAGRSAQTGPISVVPGASLAILSRFGSNVVPLQTGGDYFASLPSNAMPPTGPSTTQLNNGVGSPEFSPFTAPGLVTPPLPLTFPDRTVDRFGQL